MSTNSLNTVQDRLNTLGVRDVKFLFKRESLGVPMSDLAEDLAGLLSNFLDGKKKSFNCLPDESLTSRNS
jgi:hypothetical protein